MKILEEGTKVIFTTNFQNYAKSVKNYEAVVENRTFQEFGTSRKMSNDSVNKQPQRKTGNHTHKRTLRFLIYSYTTP